jgi:hypothetical protein
MREQGLAALLEQVEHIVEARCATVPGIRYLAIRMPREEAAEAPQLVTIVGAAQPQQRRMVGLVHSQHQVEVVEIVRADLAGGAAQFKSAPQGSEPHAAIGRVAGMFPAGARRITAHDLPEAGRHQTRAHDVFRRR